MCRTRARRNCNVGNIHTHTHTQKHVHTQICICRFQSEVSLLTSSPSISNTWPQISPKHTHARTNAMKNHTRTNKNTHTHTHAHTCTHAHMQGAWNCSNLQWAFCCGPQTLRSSFLNMPLFAANGHLRWRRLFSVRDVTTKMQKIVTRIRTAIVMQ